jgi:hypothetical protein
MYANEGNLFGPAPAVVAPAGPAPSFGVSGFSPGAPTGGGRQPLQIQRRTPAPVKRAPVRAPAKPPAKYTPRPSAAGAPRSVGGSPTGAIAPVVQPPAPAPPSIDEWLANDATFKTQNDQLAKAWADYQNNRKLQEDQYSGQYNTNVQELGKQKDQDWHSLEDDYASRGLMASGLFSKATTDFNNDYATKQSNLDKAKADFLANLMAAQQGFQSDQQVTTEKARQDAINRRAAQYGV